ncbi:hypothetical protein Tsp_07945, partial [Trichinella spiralis]
YKAVFHFKECNVKVDFYVKTV